MKKYLLTLLMGLIFVPMMAQQSVVIEGSLPQLPRTTRVGNLYYVGDTVLKKAGYERYLQQTCTPAYQVFHKGRVLATGGWCLLGVGGACVVTSIPLLLCTATYLSPVVRMALGFPSPTSTEAIVNFRIGFGLVIGGAAAVVGSLALLNFGYDKQHGAANMYNVHANPNAPAYWSLTASGTNGLGIAYNF